MPVPSFKWVLVACAAVMLAAAAASGAARAESPPSPAVMAVELKVAPEGRSGFREMPEEQTGIRFRTSARKPAAPQPIFVANPGLAAGDYDGDGLCDLFLCRFDGASTLFRNLGDWKFADATHAAGLDLDGRVLYGAAFADMDGDGHLDLIVLSLTETNSLFLNDGKGRLREARDFPWQKSPQGGDITAALADIDGDRDLDLYVTGYGQRRYKDVIPPADYERLVQSELAKLRQGRPVDPRFAEKFEIVPFSRGPDVDYRIEERGVPDTLYLNQGGGRFAPAHAADSPFLDEAGKPAPLPRGWGLGAGFRDVNGDGAPDLYACGDFLAPDRFWFNAGKGRFCPFSPFALRHTSRFSMGVDFADINRDGLPDFVLLDMQSRDHTRRIVQDGTKSPTPIVHGRLDDRPQYMQNMLFVNRGDGTFAEIAQFAGVKASEWSWTPLFLDVDLDGYEDLLVTTGMERDFMDVDVANRVKQMGELTPEQRERANLMYPPLNLPNHIFRNRGDLTFEEVGARWGFTRAAVSGGMAAADFDNDGDLDVAINNAGSAPELYRNETSAPRVAVRLRGRPPNPQAIGAKVTLLHGAVPMQGSEVTSGGRYASGSDTLLVFACGKAEGEMILEIVWPGGHVNRFGGIHANRRYEIQEPAP